MGTSNVFSRLWRSAFSIGVMARRIGVEMSPRYAAWES